MRYAYQVQVRSGQVSAVMQLAKLYQDMGNEEKALEKMAEVEELLGQIKDTETELYNLKSDGAANSVEVHEYLKRGRMAMGMDGASNKKQKAQDKEASKKKQKSPDKEASKNKQNAKENEASNQKQKSNDNMTSPLLSIDDALLA